MTTATHPPTPPSPIPARLNLAILSCAVGIACALLWACAHAQTWWGALLSAVGFSYVANTLFSLLHEATHGIAHPSPSLNRWIGRVAAAFFPTAFTLQRAFHLNHHRHNRSALEQFDYMRPSDNRFLKYAQWYAILTGLYWAFSPIGCLLWALWPGLARLPLFHQRDSALAMQTGADSYLAKMEQVPPWTTRAEVLFSASIQVGLALALDLSWASWGLCYAAFAINWSALQYADHAWSPLDARDGAWNLRVNPLTRLLFLNYHHHLAHHQHPKVPWLHLHHYIDPAAPRPSFLRIWLEMWRGPKPWPPSPTPPPFIHKPPHGD